MDECLIRQYPELESRHFWWASRRELVIDLIGGLRRGHGTSVLDVGCGSGFLARELATSGATVMGVDTVSHPQWDSSGAGVFREGDYLELAPELGVFDTVLALDVTEHVGDEGQFVSRLTGNVRPGGHVIVTVPAYDWLWSRHDDINQHFRRYTRSRLVGILTAGGLEVMRCGYIFFGLIGPKILEKGLLALHDSETVSVPPPWLNGTALAYFRLEHRFAVRRRDFLPAGTSVVAVCRRR